MPMYILTAKHMPPGVEATLYALQMGLWYAENGLQLFHYRCVCPEMS